MLFSKCLRAKIYSNINVYFDPPGCKTLLLKESEPLLFSLGSWTIEETITGRISFFFNDKISVVANYSHVDIN